MLSLKRARTDPTNDGSSQKRIRSQTLDTIPSLCSDQQDVCQDARKEVTSDAPSCSDASDHSTTPDTTDVNETERCIHKLATSCALVESVCCACADKRLGTFNYVQYVDGMGDGTGTRWQHYCPGCKDYWRMKEGTEDSLAGPLGMKDGHTRELNMTFKLWVDTVRQTLNIVGSIDLKVDDLKATVAQLLECNLEEVTLESNGTTISSNSDLFDRDHFGGIIARRCLSTIECGRADSVVDDEEDMMEDVQFTGVEPSVWYVVGEGSEQAGSITT